jgi:hypothetical protein
VTATSSCEPRLTSALIVSNTNIIARKYTDSYRNDNFGYSLRIPGSYSAISEVPLALESGIEFKLSDNSKHYIWVGAGDNTARYNSMVSAANAHLVWLRAEGEVLTVNQQPTRLGRLNGLRVSVKYKSPESDTIRIQELVLAIETKKDEVGVVYEIEMRTTESDYAKDLNVFNRILRSWRLGFR